MTQRLCRVCGKWHDLDAWPIECFPAVPDGRSDAIPVPNFIRDQMEPAMHPCTGKLIDSKSAFTRTTKAHGCIEVGDDPSRLKPNPKPKPDRAAIKRDIQIAKNRFSRGERA